MYQSYIFFDNFTYRLLIILLILFKFPVGLVIIAQCLAFVDELGFVNWVIYEYKKYRVLISDNI